ncbi:MAG: hypothetical protein AAFR73_01795 [Pseudomonadota bacterium]
MTDRLVVYTVAMGGDFDLPALPDAEGCEFVCFTDQLHEDAFGWSIRSV